MSTFAKIAIVIGVFMGGFVLGKMNVPSPLDGVIQDAKENVEQSIESYSQSTSTQAETKTKTVDSSAEAKAAVNVSSNTLTDSQKKMLESFGVDTNAITVTATMIACAEAKLGKARIEEIKNGATPSMLESASLLTCYKK
jgi:hypothetical protein